MRLNFWSAQALPWLAKARFQASASFQPLLPQPKKRDVWSFQPAKTSKIVRLNFWSTHKSPCQTPQWEARKYSGSGQQGAVSYQIDAPYHEGRNLGHVFPAYCRSDGCMVWSLMSNQKSVIDPDPLGLFPGHIRTGSLGAVDELSLEALATVPRHKSGHCYSATRDLGLSSPSDKGVQG